MKTGINRTLVPPLAGLVAFAVMALLYLSGNKLVFDAVLQTLGVRPYRFAFLDTETVLSAARCLRQGVDAYAYNPCDPEVRTYVYSPLWMLLTALPVTPGWIPWVGMLANLIFLSALLLLPAAREDGGMKMIVAGVLSSTTILAMERGNNDLVVFAVVATAGALMQRQGALRMAAYGFATLAGLLKYYPMLTMATALRERPWRFLAIAAASLVVSGLFAAVTWHDLIRTWAQIPQGSPFGEMFGVPNLGKGLVEIFALDPLAAPVIRVAMIIGALAVGLRLGLGGSGDAALAGLSARERDFLLLGALMVLGCYFSAQNINYRGINLLLALPALAALRGLGAPRWLRRASWLALALLFADFLRVWVVLAALQTKGLLFQILFFGPGWLLREMAWWWMACTFVGCAAALLKAGPIPAAVLRRPGGR